MTSRSMHFKNMAKDIFLKYIYFKYIYSPKAILKLAVLTFERLNKYFEVL